jgi:NhaA family Na+:H+ antiporter
MFIGNKLGVKNVIFYAVLGICGVWTAFLFSGVHATISAVLAAFVIPADVVLPEKFYVNRINSKLNRFETHDPNPLSQTLNEHQLHILDGIRRDTIDVIPPLQRLEHGMHPFVTFLVIPIFAFANSGVSFVGMEFSTLFSTNVIFGVAFGLLLGKVIGVVGFTYLLVKLKIGSLPGDVNFRKMLGIGFLAAIGFTMSIFITSLAFSDELFVTQAKVGIFAASIIGGIIGFMILKNSK